MHASAGRFLVGTTGHQLGEHRRDLCMLCRAADVVLTCQLGVGVDDELAGGGVIGGRGLDGLHIGAVSGLGHGEAAEHIEIDQAGYVLLVVDIGAEVLHRAAEQAPLDSRFHHQRQIGVAEEFDRADRSTDVAGASVLLQESGAGEPVTGQFTHDLEDASAGLVQRERRVG